MKEGKSIKHMSSTIEEETNKSFLEDPQYREALDWIGQRARVGEKDGLRNIRALLKKLGNPEKELRCFHIAGTNGKGSAAELLSSVLQEAGYKTGLFTSPYIETFRERFQINHELIGKDPLIALLTEARKYVEELEREGVIPTHFEILTAICFRYFADEKVDFAVMEVGVGGLYDSTNVIEKPLASLITTIDYDHTLYLGDTLPEIARHKAGIIKEGCPVFLYPNEAPVMETIRAVAREKKADVHTLESREISELEVSSKGTSFHYRGEPFRLNMIGAHQAVNASLVLLCLKKLRQLNILAFSDQALTDGLAKAKLMVRMEVLQERPLLLLDGAHNVQGARALLQNLCHFDYERLILGIGVFQDKSFRDILEIFVPLADKVVATELPMPRKLPAHELAEEVVRIRMSSAEASCPNPSGSGERITPFVSIETDIGKALVRSLSMAGPEDLVLWCGSLYLVGDIRKRYLKKI